MTTTSASAAAARARPAPSRPRSRPARPRRPAAPGRSTVVTSVTLAPRGGGLVGEGVALLARRAVGDDPHRVDRLAGAAGGDEHAQPGEVAAGRARASTAATMSPGSARRPAPTSPPARRPDSGSTTCTPRRRSVARLSCTAGCSHISVCMAGQTTHRRPGGQQRGGEQVVGDARRRRRRAAGPWPGRHDQVGRLAEAGVRDRVGARPTATSGPARRPAPRTWCAPTKRAAPSVMTGATWAPASTRRRQTSMAL